MPLTTWAGSHTFRGGPLVRPTSVAEVARVVADASHVRAIGSRHSFHDLADGPARSSRWTGCRCRWRSGTTTVRARSGRP